MTLAAIKKELAFVNAEIEKLNFDENDNAIGDRFTANQLFTMKDELEELLVRVKWDDKTSTIESTENLLY